LSRLLLARSAATQPADYSRTSISDLSATRSAAVGGGLGGQILRALIPALTGATATASAGGFDIAAALGQAAGGGVTGAIVTVVVGLIKNALMGPKRG